MTKRKEQRRVIKVTENNIQDSILRFLNGRPGFFAWRNNNTGIYDPKSKIFRPNNGPFDLNGVSDILGWKVSNASDIPYARILAIEVKTPKNKKRPPEQVAFIEKIKRDGGIAFFSTSITDTIEQLKLFDIEI